MKLTVSKLKIILLLLLALTLIFIWTNSMQSRSESTKRSSQVLELVADILEPVGIDVDTTDDRPIRKLAHFAEFFLLGTELAALCLLYGMCSAQGFINSLSAGLAAAVTDETIQIFSDRGSSVADVLLDFSGVLAATAAVWLIYRLKSKRNNRTNPS